MSTTGSVQHSHPIVLAQEARRAADLQLRIADAITAFAGSMPFVYIHAVAFAVWISLGQRSRPGEPMGPREGPVPLPIR
jgi:uncharacterized membrane protein